MDKVYEELNEAKAEIEKLKAEELRDKTDSLQDLNNSHDSQVNQIQETKFAVQNLEKELLQKEDEINDAKLICEDIKENLDNKEFTIKLIGAENVTFQPDFEEKFKKLEDEKRRLELVLEEANEKLENQEQQIFLYRQEIENLKGSLSVSNMCLEIEENLKASKELEERDDMLLTLEEENNKVDEQLQFNMSGKNEWELEKSTLLDEISSLQIKLESQVRISQDLQHQLQMCNQSLAQEESQRKCLEVEVSDSNVRFDKVRNEYQGARSQLCFLNSQLNKNNEDPRYSMKTKEEYYEELKYSIEKLEQENYELRMSLKVLQESGASYSESKLLSELRNLEQIHKECDSAFKAIKAEWSFQVEQLTGTINSLWTELENKTAAVKELNTELETSHSLTAEVMLLNEELSVMLLVFQQGISETQLKLSNYEDRMKMKDVGLMRQPAKELEEHKKMLEESTKCQIIPKEKFFHMEFDLQEQLREVYDALDKAKIELNEAMYERSEMELELQMWMSFVKRLHDDLEESLVMRKKLESSLLAQVDFSESLKEEKENRIDCLQRHVDCLQRHVVQLEQEQKVRETESCVPISVTSKTDEVRYLQMIEEKNKILEELKKETVWLEQESFRREVESAVIAEIKMERTNELEKEIHIKGENMRTDEFLQQVTSLEQQFTSSLTSTSSQLAEKQAEINEVQEACDKIKAVEIIAALESKQLALDVEAKMDTKQFKTKDLTHEMENELKGSDVLLQKLKIENRNLHENATRLSSEKENLLHFIQVLYDKMCDATTADTEIMEMLNSLVQSFENNGPGMNLIKDDEFLANENMIMLSPTGTKKPDTFSDIRPPFKELNIVLEG